MCYYVNLGLLLTTYFNNWKQGGILGTLKVFSEDIRR